MFYVSRLPKIFFPLASLTFTGLTIFVCPKMAGSQMPLMPERSAPGSNDNATLQGQEDYTLRPGDNIRIDNMEGKELSGEYLIPPDGRLFLPMIGGISVVGLTVEEASAALTNAYRRFFKDPYVSVNLLLISPITITITGEVRNPGSYNINLQNIRDHRGIEVLKLTQAIQQCGGVTLGADLSNIQISRKTRSGGQKVVYVNLWDFILRGDQTQNIALREGDNIYIPTTTEINLAQIRQLANVTFVTDLTTPRTVTLVGEVTRPGTYVIKGGDTTGGDKPFAGRYDGLPTVIRAIQLAGGVTPSADIEKISLRRINQNATEQTVNLNLWAFWQNGDVTQDTIIQEGDVIFIPTATNLNEARVRQLLNANFTANVNSPRTVLVVGEVKRPGSFVVRGGDGRGADTQFSSGTDGLPTVIRAIQMAGGITEVADIRRIQLRRRSRDGGEQILDVNLWELLQTGNLYQDRIVEEGDVIVVPKATEINPVEVSALSTASFAAPKITVFIMGEEARPPGVKQDGGLDFPPNISLNQALLASGALNRTRANRNFVDLLRLNPNGTVEQRRIEIDLADSINETTNPLLRNNDVILVNRSNFTKVIDDYNTFADFLLVGPRLLPWLQILDLFGIVNF